MGRASRKIIRSKGNRAIGYHQGLAEGQKLTVDQAAMQTIQLFFGAMALVLRRQLKIDKEQIRSVMTNTYQEILMAPSKYELFQQVFEECGMKFDLDDPIYPIKEI